MSESVVSAPEMILFQCGSRGQELRGTLGNAPFQLGVEPFQLNNSPIELVSHQAHILAIS